MNRVILMGRLTADLPEKPNETSNGKKFVKFSMAVPRPRVGVDFINCEAWEGTAGIMCKYLKKGSQFLIEGYITVSSWMKGEEKRYSQNVVVDKLYFVGKREDNLEPKAEFTAADSESLPFN